MPTDFPYLEHGGPCTGGPAVAKPCLAFLEFDEKGQLAAPAQLDAVLSAIERAKTSATPPAILLFVHGWKQNASPGTSTPKKDGVWNSPEDSNVQGFEEALDLLATSQFSKRPVLGIYVAWRGDSISHFMPVTRQLTVYRREKTAREQIGKHLTDSLRKIIAAAHPSDLPSGKRPFFMMIGHSFGAVVLETAVTPIFADLLGQPGARSVETPADLIAYINSANAAEASKQVVNLFTLRGLTYRTASGRDMPLIVSASSIDDIATGLIYRSAHTVTPTNKQVAHALPVSIQSGFRAQAMLCGAPDASFQSDTTHALHTYWTRTAPRLQLLQSHELQQWKPKDEFEKRPESCPAKAQDAFNVFMATNRRCFQIQPAYSSSGKPPCNRTPYWIMQVDKNIVPDHSTIFSLDLIRFLKLFLPNDLNASPVLSITR